MAIYLTRVQAIDIRQGLSYLHHSRQKQRAAVFRSWNLRLGIYVCRYSRPRQIWIIVELSDIACHQLPSVMHESISGCG